MHLDGSVNELVNHQRCSSVDFRCAFLCSNYKHDIYLRLWFNVHPVSVGVDIFEQISFHLYTETKCKQLLSRSRRQPNNKRTWKASHTVRELPSGWYATPDRVKVLSRCPRDVRNQWTLDRCIISNPSAMTGNTTRRQQNIVASAFWLCYACWMLCW